MAARDRIYRAVYNALIRDGWTITHDPYRLAHEGDVVEIDLGAERTIAAQRGEGFPATPHFTTAYCRRRTIPQLNQPSTPFHRFWVPLAA